MNTLRFRLAFLFAALLFAPSMAARAEDAAPDDSVYVVGSKVPLKGRVGGFHDGKLELKTPQGVVRVERRFLRSIVVGCSEPALFEDDFKGAGISARWEVTRGEWSLDGSAVTGHADDDNAALLLREGMQGDISCELDAEVRTSEEFSGLHVSLGGMSWYMYPTRAGIYPPEIDGELRDWWTRDGEDWVLKNHFKFVCRGDQYSFYVGNQLFMQAKGKRCAVLGDRVELCAAHRATVRFSNFRISSATAAPGAESAEFKAPTDVLVRLNTGSRVMGSFADGTRVAIDGAAVALEKISWVVFPPSVETGSEIEIPAELENRIAALVKSLGDDSPDVREQAQQDLVLLGPLTIPALQRSARDEDAEVRFRVKSILEEFANGTTPPAPDAGDK